MICVLIYFKYKQYGMCECVINFNLYPKGEFLVSGKIQSEINIAEGSNKHSKCPYWNQLQNIC
jgi:hypothetical protein